MLELMSKHRVPRWINVLWLVLVFGLTCSFIGLAVWRGYDLVQTLGFLATHFGIIFSLAIVAGLGLYGLSILLEGPKVHKSCGEEDDHSGDMANFVP
jgi:hypothetical protein